MKKKQIAWLLAIGMLVGSINSASTNGKTVSATDISQITTLKTASGSALTTTPGGISSGSSIITPTITMPTAPTITSAIGGSQRVKLRWSEMSQANGYKIYYATSKYGSYKLATTITDHTTTSYIQTGLKKNKRYYFKVTSYIVVSGLAIESTYSPAVSAKTCSVSSTSKTPKLYSSKKKFKASAAYKKYKALSKYSTYSKSFAIPGMKNTNIGGFAAKKMIPQGMCQAGGFILISAYDSTKKNESVIYVLSRSSHTYITTIVLPTRTKVQSMAYDGKNIWIGKDSSIAYFPFSVITNAALKGSSYYNLVKFTKTQAVKTSVGVMAFYSNTLWIGKAGSSKASKMYGYKISKNKKGIYKLSQEYTMAIPARTQGITFDSKGYMYLTRSNKTNPKNKNYVSRIQTYKPAISSPSKNGTVAKKTVVKKLNLPPMAEGVAVSGQYLYTLYSSCQYSASKYPVDRVIATKLTKLR